MSTSKRGGDGEDTRGNEEGVEARLIQIQIPSQLQEIRKMLEEDRKQFLAQFFAQREETAEARLIQILDGYERSPQKVQVEIVDKRPTNEEKLKVQVEILERRSQETEEKLKALEVLDGKALGVIEEKLEILERKFLEIEEKLKTVEILERRSLETNKKLQTMEEKLDKVLAHLGNTSQIQTPPSPLPTSPSAAGLMVGSSNSSIIYMWRTQSARSSCGDFKMFLQSYIDQNLSIIPVGWFIKTKKTFIVEEVKSSEELKNDGILVLIGYTASIRVEAESIIAQKRTITQSGFQGKIFFIMLRFGEKASPSKIEDEKGQEVVLDPPCLNIYYDSRGFIFNDITKASIKQIVNSF